MTTGPGALELLLKREKTIIVSVLLAVMAIAWAYTLAGVGMSMNAVEMTRMPIRLSDRSGFEYPLNTASRDGVYVIIMLLMWWLMMIAMMLPGATPVILLAAALNRRSNCVRSPFGHALYFTAGYLLAWLFFSLFAVLLQGLLERYGVLSSMLQNRSLPLAGGLLIAAGLWQFTPIKQACLRHCRSPVGFLTRYRRPGHFGALRMGLRHGVYCLGCCWFLMGLLFVVSVMNLFWIVGLALFVLVEKLFARGPGFGKIAGLVLIGSGVILWVV